MRAMIRWFHKLLSLLYPLSEGMQVRGKSCVQPAGFTVGRVAMLCPNCGVPMDACDVCDHPICVQCKHHCPGPLSCMGCGCALDECGNCEAMLCPRCDTNHTCGEEEEEEADA